MAGPVAPAPVPDGGSDRPWRGGQLGLGLGILLAPLLYMPGLTLGAAAAAAAAILALRHSRWPGRIPLAVLAAAAVGGALGTLADGPPVVAGLDRAENLRVLLKTVTFRALVGGMGFVGVGALIITRSRRAKAPTPHRSGWSTAVWGVLIVVGAVVVAGFDRTYGESVPRASLRAQMQALAEAQATYYRDHQQFASRLTDLPGFETWAGTLVIERADEEWWSARAWSQRMLCTAVGEAPADEPPRIECAKDRSWFRSDAP